MKLIRLAILMFLGCAAGSVASASDSAWRVRSAPELSKAVDRLHEPFADNPGAIVAILKDDEVVHLNGYGFANREFRIPWDPTVLYTFFSTTKPMVAVALFRLQQMGRVNLDDEIQKYLPDFPRFSHSVSIRHLLTHTSGLWQDEVLVNLSGTGMSYDAMTLDEMYELGKRQPSLAFTPGSVFYYNDAGTRYLARIIERIMGTSFRDAMQALVFQPAGMTSADIKPREPMYFPREASAYLLEQHQDTVGAVTAAVDIGGLPMEVSGDGGGVGSINDFIAFARFLDGNHRRSAHPLIDQLVAPVHYCPGVVGSYRYCFAEFKHRGYTVYSHSGFHGKLIAFIPELHVWLLIMRNGLDFGPPAIRDMGNYTRSLLDLIVAELSPPGERPNQSLSSAVFGRPPEETFTSEEYKALLGKHVEPRSGYVVSIRKEGARLVFSFLGEGGYLVRIPGEAGRFRSYSGGGSAPVIDIQIEPRGNGTGIALLQGDWGAPKPLTTLGTAPRQASSVPISGLYREPHLGVVYEIVTADTQSPVIRIGSGSRASDRLTLTHVIDDIYEFRQQGPGTYGVLEGVIQFARDSAGRATGFTLTHNRARGLTFERLNTTNRTSP